MIKKPLYKLLLFAVILFVSCEKLSDDPLSEQEKLDLMEVFLSQAQIQLAQTAGHDHAIYSSLFTQQIAGTHGKTMQIERYDITARDTDEAWINWYAGVMSLLKTVKTTAEETNQKKFAGISKVMLALAASHVADAWGDMPFSASILQDTPTNYPIYDSQRHVYEQIFELLHEAEILLSESGSFFFPGAEDYLFNGNATHWLEFIAFLRARFHLTISNQKGLDPLTDLLAHSPSWSPGYRVAINFGIHELAEHPVYTYNQANTGGLRAGATLLALMDNGDPRISVYFRKNNNDQIVGSQPGSGTTTASHIASRFTASDASVVLASFTEWMFIKAEVYYRAGQTVQALESLRQGMASSLIECGIQDHAWVDEYLDAVPINLEIILSQKHIALFMQPQVFNDWRRTGIPFLEPAMQNVTNNLMPRRFPYPLNEHQYNPNNVPSDIHIWEPVWWENENN